MKPRPRYLLAPRKATLTPDLQRPPKVQDLATVISFITALVYPRGDLRSLLDRVRKRVTRAVKSGQLRSLADDRFDTMEVLRWMSRQKNWRIDRDGVPRVAEAAGISPSAQFGTPAVRVLHVSLAACQAELDSVRADRDRLLNRVTELEAQAAHLPVK